MYYPGKRSKRCGFKINIITNSRLCGLSAYTSHQALSLFTRHSELYDNGCLRFNIGKVGTGFSTAN